MAKDSPPAFLLKIEVLIMVVFFLAFSFWAVRKCNVTKEQYRLREAMEREVDSTAMPPARDSLRRRAIRPDTLPVNQKPQVPELRVTTLYVIEDGLKLRTRPSLSSEVLEEMKLGEELVFMNEVTDFRDSINLGSRIAYEPWVKVRHSRGRAGWVYGAGVSYYKQKSAR